jgi:hypothetical protein
MFFVLLPKTFSLLRCVVVKLGQFYEELITRSSTGSEFTTKHLSNEEGFGKTANDILKFETYPGVHQ